MGKDYIHPETSQFVDEMTKEGFFSFDEDKAREVSNKLGLKMMYIVWRNMVDYKIISPHPHLKGFYTFNFERLEFLFSRMRWN